MLGYFAMCVCFVLFFVFCFSHIGVFSALVCFRLYLVISVLFSYICFLVLGLF